MKKHLFWCILFLTGFVQAQNPSKFVNVFLGTSGDHGQLSPAASNPFRMLSIGPQNYPNTHTGYEYYAKEYVGFTHNRMEGAGCQGDGENLLVKPFHNNWDRGIDPYVGRIYQNNPKAFLRTMDGDAGTMTSWFVLAASGLTQACVGLPFYYIHMPLFDKIVLNSKSQKPLKIEVSNFNSKAIYVIVISFNGKKINRNWITQDEINQGGELKIEASNKPYNLVSYEPWIA